MFQQNNQKLWFTVFLLAIILFLALTAIAAYLYPGGTKFDPHTKGIDYIDNFLCDLFEPVTYDGRKNPGQIYSIIGGIILVIGLVIFWSTTPGLITTNKMQARLIKLLGSSGMIALIFVPVFHHQAVITAGLSGLSAFYLTLKSLYQCRQKPLFWCGVITFLLCFCGCLLWFFQFLPRSIPVIQKVSLIGYLAWSIALMAKTIDS